MTTYTVYRSEDSSQAESGLTLAEAAEKLLTSDGHTYSIEEASDLEGWFRLSISDASTNSTRGAGHMQWCPRYSSYGLENVHRKVVETRWRGLIAVTDEAFAAMRQQALEPGPAENG